MKSIKKAAQGAVAKPLGALPVKFSYNYNLNFFVHHRSPLWVSYARTLIKIMTLKLYFLSLITIFITSCSDKDDQKNMNLRVSGIPNSSGQNLNLDQLGSRIAQASLLKLKPH